MLCKLAVVSENSLTAAGSAFAIAILKARQERNGRLPIPGRLEHTASLPVCGL